ncbi:hypothetical protein EV121DRAFT_284696 [Schizophyllum commune]
MRAADRAYYGVYTPSCPIQPDSLRNRLYGAASWSSRLRADGLITYDGGLGERNIKAMEFAHLLEVLAKEMQPVLDTLVKATVADQAEAPNTWRFEIREHARSLREARSHIDLSCAHIRATTECGKAVRFYRKYRQQAEDILRATPQPGLAQRATDLPASDTPIVQRHPSGAAREHPSVTLDPSIFAEAQPSPPVRVHQASDAPSEPLLGLPAEGEEVGHGSPALVPPHKDAIGCAGDDSNSAGSRTSLAADWQCIARDPTLSGRMSEAARQEPRAQTTPSEVALPSEEQQREAYPLDIVLRKTWRERLDDSARDSMEATNPRGRCQVPQESHALKSPRGKLPQLSIPRARRRRPHSGSPAYTTVLAKTALPEARTRPAPSSDSSTQTIEEWGISMREERRERRAPWSKTRQIARSQRQRLSSCGATATVELMVTARAEAQEAAVSPAKVKGRPESPELRSSQIVPTPVRSSSPPSSTTSHNWIAARPRMCPAPLVDSNERVIKKCEVSAREESREERAPRSDAQQLTARTRKHPGPSSTLNDPASADDVSRKMGSGARHAPWSKTPRAAPSQQQRLSSGGLALTLGPVEGAQERRLAAPILYAKAGGNAKGAECARHVLAEGTTRARARDS